MAQPYVVAREQFSRRGRDINVAISTDDREDMERNCTIGLGDIPRPGRLLAMQV